MYNIMQMNTFAPYKNIFLLTALCLTVFAALGYAFDDGDWEYWNTESISWKFTEDWKATVEEEFRFGDDMQDFYYQHSDFGLAYAGLAEWLELGAHYRQVFEEKSGVWKQENRPHLNATVKMKLEGVGFSNRFRFEYRNREDSDNFWRYRNKTSIKLPIKWTPFDIQPYLADEIFVDFDAEELNANRFYAGLTFTIYKQLKGEAYYLWQSKKSDSEWTDANIVGTKLKLVF